VEQIVWWPDRLHLCARAGNSHRRPRPCYGQIRLQASLQIVEWLHCSQWHGRHVWWNYRDARKGEGQRWPRTWGSLCLDRSHESTGIAIRWHFRILAGQYGNHESLETGQASLETCMAKAPSAVLLAWLLQRRVGIEHAGLVWLIQWSRSVYASTRLHDALLQQVWPDLQV